MAYTYYSRNYLRISTYISKAKRGRHPSSNRDNVRRVYLTRLTKTNIRADEKAGPTISKRAGRRRERQTLLKSVLVVGLTFS